MFSPASLFHHFVDPLPSSPLSPQLDLLYKSKTLKCTKFHDSLILLLHRNVYGGRIDRMLSCKTISVGHCRLLFHVMENTLLLSQSSEFKPSKTTDKCFFSTLVLNRSFILHRYSS